jgi:hypothetical protein
LRSIFSTITQETMSVGHAGELAQGESLEIWDITPLANDRPPIVLSATRKWAQKKTSQVNRHSMRL